MTEFKISTNRSLPAAMLAAFVCFVLTLLILLPRLGDAPLAGTEGHRAVTAHQMLQSHNLGDWLVPKLYGRTYLRKPPGFYWVLAAVEHFTGRANEWIWRLPSVVSSGLLASVLALFGYRWFGIRGAWASGLSFAALVALWAQSRTADIDAINTLVTLIAAFGIIELHFGNPRRPWAWMLLIGVMFGCSLLLKFHAGMPVILGVFAFSVLASRDSRSWEWFSKPWSLGGLAIGVGIMLVWVGMALFFGLLNDTNGLREAVEKALPVTLTHPDAGSSEPALFARLLKAILVPPQLFLFSLPFSIALLMVLNRDVRSAMDTRTQRLVAALAGSLLASWVICTLAGMTNARYGNITLPLICPIVGALAANLSRFTYLQRRELRVALIVIACMLLIAQPILLGVAWKTVADKAPLFGATGVGVLAASIAIYMFTKRGSFAGAVAVLASIYALSIPISAKAVQDRYERSGFYSAKVLREIAGPYDPVVTGAMLRFQPELFYYSGTNTRAYSEELPAPDKLPELLPTGGWLVLNDNEHAALKLQIPARLAQETSFQTNGKKCWIVRYQP